jgi:hypothetical protein
MPMRNFFAIGVFALFTSPVVFAHSPFGVGPALGDPLGVTANYELDLDRSIDAFAGWSSGSRVGTQLHADYLQIVAPAASIEEQQLFFYWGVGGRLIEITSGSDKGKTAIGLRVPLGLETEFTDYSWQGFVELAPVLDVVPSTELDADIMIGARYYF